MRPFFSIVMPTRNRAKTLEYAIQTALFQDFDDYEVVVSDNCSVDHTEDVVRGQQDPKVRYLRTPSPLAMSKNWEYGLSQARGMYRLILSDDDGLLQDTLSNLHRSIRETGAKIIRWHRAQYNWPNFSLWGQYENLLIYTKPRSESRFMPSDAITRNAIRYLDCNDTPGLVNSAIHADVFEKLQKRTGKLILSYSPDTCSGITMPCLVDKVYMYEKVNSIAGQSELSNGMLIVKKENTSIEKEFVDLNKKVKDYHSTYMDSLGGSISSMVLDSIHEVARHFPEKIELHDINMLRVYAQSIVEYTWVENRGLRKQLIENLYSLAQNSHGWRGLLKVKYLAARGMTIHRLNSPRWRPLTSTLRAVLNKRYGSPVHYNGKEFGFSNILEACNFFATHVAQPNR